MRFLIKEHNKLKNSREQRFVNRYYRLKRLLKKGVILLMIKEPTEEQAKILSHEGNIVVTARPGSGKTYTVVEK